MCNINCKTDFCIDDVVTFRSVERKFLQFFTFNFCNNDNINHCTEEDKFLLMKLAKNILNYFETTDQNSLCGVARKGEVVETYGVTLVKPYEMYYCDTCTAVLFAFYVLVLLELSGDTFSIEEICHYMRIQNAAIPKIQEIYYGIIWGDNPLLAEIRGRILFPHRYIR